MANEEHLAILKRGVKAWNQWLDKNRIIQPDLAGADLREVALDGANLREADLVGANLSMADLRQAHLLHADLRQADLFGAQLQGMDLFGVDLTGADLRAAFLGEAQLVGVPLIKADLTGAHLMEADLSGAHLMEADLTGAHLMEADLTGADLREADLTGANLREADLTGANLTRANLTRANLTRANLTSAILVETKFSRVKITGCRVYGIAAWNVNLVGAQQSDLVITPAGEPVITVDNLEVAQFIYLLLHNEKIRHVIETVTSKAVLILGRFMPERKAVLDAIREELRNRNYVPILFDFEGPQTRDFTETISTLARMARFIIADLTEPSSLPKELEAIVPTLAVPVQPVLAEGIPYSMFQDYWKYSWVLPVSRYKSLARLMASLGDQVIAPAEAKVQELTALRRAQAEAQLTPRPATG